MIILGINAYHGDASAAIVCDGKLVAAAEEERFCRVKHVAGFPHQAIAYCLQAAGVKPQDLTHIAISRNPSAHLERKIVFALSKGTGLRMIKDRLANASKVRDVKGVLADGLGLYPTEISAEVHYVEHHRAHLASSFFVSGFDEAALVSVDGFGDFVSTMWGVGRGSQMKIDGHVGFPHSLGVLYTAVTQYLGFPKYGDEYKVMGLAAYDQPAYLDEFRQLVRRSGELGFVLDLSYFTHHSEGVLMTWNEGAPALGRIYSPKMVSRFGPPRGPSEEVSPKHAQLAASLQAVLEEVVLDLLNKLYEKTRTKQLCLAGGVALNCVVNGKILEQTPFEQIYIQPAAYDGGTSLGAAFYVWHQLLRKERGFTMDHAYWGPEFSDSRIKAALDHSRLGYGQVESDQLTKLVAEEIAKGRIVGLFQGRMEFGPRALGNRSIVVDPRRAEMKDILNRRIKHREPFRPFAPSVLEESVGDYFEQSHPSPFMLMTYKVKEDKLAQIPAPTHVDGSGRLQTVSRATNPFYWQLIKEFERLTGVPVVLNTSFNENEPIVCTPEEAIECFLRTQMDVLAIGNYLVHKEE
jgi:carbamoyltransferase